MSLDLTLKNREFNFNVTNPSQHKVYEFEDFRLDAAHKLLTVTKRKFPSRRRPLRR